MLRRLVVLLMTLAAAFPVLAAGTRSFEADPVLQDLPGRWSAMMDLFDVPGAAVAVVKDGHVFIETFGFRDPATGAPVTPETIFYVASITKTYNATAIGTLVDQGRLSLDDRVKDHLPRLRLADPRVTETLTVRDLLSHRQGLRSGAVVLLDAFTGEITEDRYYHWLARGEVAGKPVYSNIHYTLVGRVIEQVTGEDWRDYLKQAVLAPAGLDRTTGYASVMYADSDSAVPTTRTGGAWLPVEQRKTDRTMHAAGGLGTTARDAARYLALHLGDGELDGKRILSAAFASEMRNTQARYDEPNGSIRIMEGFGLGWEVGAYTGKARLCSHGGAYTGSGAWFALLPEQNAGLAILINGDGLARGWGDIVAIDLLERLTGLEPPWTPYERYPATARERKAKSPASDRGPGVLPSSALSRPVGLYTGWFHHPQLGTLVVENDGDALAFHLGDAPLAAFAADEPDRFTLEGQFDPPAACRFVLSPGGRIEEVRVEDEELGDPVFRR